MARSTRNTRGAGRKKAAPEPETVELEVPEVDGYNTVSIGGGLFALYPQNAGPGLQAVTAEDTAPDVDDDDEAADEGEAPDREVLMSTDLRVLKRQARDEYDLDPDEVISGETTAAKKKAALVEAILESAGVEEDDEDEDDEDEDEDDDEGDEEYTEEELSEMDIKDLRTVAKDEFQIATRGKKAPALIAEILEAQEGEEDEDEDEDEEDDEGAELSEDDLKAMSLPDLVQVAKDNEVKLTPRQAKNKSKAVAAIIEALGEEE